MKRIRDAKHFQKNQLLCLEAWRSMAEYKKSAASFFFSLYLSRSAPRVWSAGLSLVEVPESPSG